MRIWTYKNADEKAHTFSRRSKNVKKRTKTYEKRILCKFTFIDFLEKIQAFENAHCLTFLDFLEKIQAFENAHCLTFLGEEHLNT